MIARVVASAFFVGCVLFILALVSNLGAVV